MGIAPRGGAAEWRNGGCVCVLVDAAGEEARTREWLVKGLGLGTCVGGNRAVRNKSHSIQNPNFHAN